MEWYWWLIIALSVLTVGAVLFVVLTAEDDMKTEDMKTEDTETEEQVDEDIQEEEESYPWEIGGDHILDLREETVAAQLKSEGLRLSVGEWAYAMYDIADDEHAHQKTSLGCNSSVRTVPNSTRPRAQGEPEEARFVPKNISYYYFTGKGVGECEF